LISGTDISGPDEVEALLTDEAMKEKVGSLKVINDAAQRGIAMIKRCQQSVRS
jgi:hypothetical protein